MKLMGRMKMARFQIFWIQMRKNKHLDESRKTGQTSGMNWHFTLLESFLTSNHITGRIYKLTPNLDK
ncbi:hypothetical protein Hanom_Chr15g01383521 [Helianthus anomalus]